MPFMNTTCNVTRLAILEGSKRLDIHLLQRHCFQPIDDMPSEDKSVGWVNIDDMLDSSWSVSPPQKGEYIAFSMRIDARRITPAVLKKEFQKAIQIEKERNKDTGKQFITRERKKELREQVVIRLKRITVPVPKIIDVIVDERSATVYITTTIEKEIAEFCELFARCFDINVEPIDYYAVASGAFPEKQEQVDTIEDASFGSGDALTSLDSSNTLLGRDFLTFAWFFSEVENGEFRRDDGPFSLHIESPVAISGVGGAKVAANSGAEAQDSLSEAKLGIAIGKKVNAAKLRLERDALSCLCKLNLNFAVSGMRLPRTDTNSDEPDATFLERMYLMEQMWKMLDTAFVVFLYARLDSEAWKSVSARINLWLRTAVSSDHLNITIQSHEHTSLIYLKWFEQITERQQSADAVQ